MSEAIRQGDVPGVQLRCRALLSRSREEAWPLVAEPAGWLRWLAEQVEPSPEGGWVLRGGGAEPWWEFWRPSTADSPRRFEVSCDRVGGGWSSPLRLTLDLARTPSGTELSVLQKGFQLLSLSECLTIWEEHRRRWRAALNRLSRLAELAGPVDDEPST